MFEVEPGMSLARLERRSWWQVGSTMVAVCEWGSRAVLAGFR